ncbi:MAG TPA: hypothetical protein VII75_12370 [Thermoanaerobaculia bacterium]|jgi:hypothetical protein|nr:hypothetical protein [Thermoanaerobaculia bacterium]
MLSFVRRSKVLAVVFALAALLTGVDTAVASCPSRSVWIENYTDGTVRLHIWYLQDEYTSNGGTVCVYG